MNLTLFRLDPFVPGQGSRVLYVLAPTVQAALECTRHEMPHPKTVTALANNAWQGEDFPRFIAWEQPADVPR